MLVGAVAGAVVLGFVIAVLASRGGDRRAAATTDDTGPTPTIATLPPAPSETPPSSTPPSSTPSAPTPTPAVIAAADTAPDALAIPDAPPAIAPPTAVVAPTAPPASTTVARPRTPRPATTAPSAPATRPTTAAPADAPASSSDPLVVARQRLAAGDTAGAIKLIEGELRDTPGRPALYEALGDARARTGNRVAAIAAYRRYLALVGDADRSDRSERVRGKLKQLGGL